MNRAINCTLSLNAFCIFARRLSEALISSPSALAWHEEIIDNREDEQCQQKPVEYRFLFALEKLVCVHFPFAFSPRCENELRTAEYSVRPSLPFWRHFPFAFHLAFYGG
jgi:hypothetical protein